jgi:hypothetical protein
MYVTSPHRPLEKVPLRTSMIDTRSTAALAAPSACVAWRTQDQMAETSRQRTGLHRRATGAHDGCDRQAEQQQTILPSGRNS